MANACPKRRDCCTVTVNASSLQQFFKMLPLGSSPFIIIQSRIFTKEHQSGTLVLVVTRGMRPHQNLWSQSNPCLSLSGRLVTAQLHYHLRGYTILWDNDIAHNLLFSVVCWWLFGLLMVSLVVLFSTMAKSNTGVIAGVGFSAASTYMISFYPKLSPYTPTLLTAGNALVRGLKNWNKPVAKYRINKFRVLPCVF